MVCQQNRVKQRSCNLCDEQDPPSFQRLIQVGWSQVVEEHVRIDQGIVDIPLGLVVPRSIRLIIREGDVLAGVVPALYLVHAECNLWIRH